MDVLSPGEHIGSLVVPRLLGRRPGGASSHSNRDADVPSGFPQEGRVEGGLSLREVREIDGAAFDDLEGFAAEFSSKVLLGAYRWNGSLDAFNDILRGGFGTPEGGFTLRILNSTAARRSLGYGATIKWLEERVRRCHPTNVPAFTARLESARRSEGRTLFDEIVEIIRVHGPGGSEAEDGVILEMA